ncbi:MAG: phosphoribosylamine--glycine ligase [Fimbriimonadales bacterium]|nr:MAG: phosphoribosylamine--glycine ligase [Fimbriimonadales bacterium]
MRVLVLGGGGREHALAWRLAQSESVEEVFALPGNPGIAECAHLVEGDPLDANTVLQVVQDNGIDLTVVGPEAPLLEGVADLLRDAGRLVYGPNQRPAQIEGSKAFAKQLMAEEGVPTADFAVCTTVEQADEAMERLWLPEGIVVKASGAALGKGAIVCDSQDEARRAARRMLVDREFGEAGATIVVEQRLNGRELSLFAVCNGQDYVLLPTAQDYKRAEDGDRGPNTGGMGAFSPVEDISDETLQDLAETFIRPVIKRLAKDGTPYIGTLYAGLMLTADGPFALEYNARFGDPETQCVLPRLKGDFARLLESAAAGRPMAPLETDSRHAVVVVVAARGYPGSYPKGLPLPSLSLAGDNMLVFHAGTRFDGERIVSAGGRVLNVVCLAEERAKAAAAIYEALAGLGEEWHYRKDIGRTSARMRS